MSGGGWNDGELLCRGPELRGLWRGLWHASTSLPLLSGCLSPRVSLSPFSGRERQGPAAGGAPGLTCVAGQGEFRVAERKVTMKELLRALEEGRVREVFGSGTACQVCPVHQILYQGKVRWAAVGDGREKGVPGPHTAVSSSTCTFPPWKTGLSLSSAS